MTALNLLLIAVALLLNSPYQALGSYIMPCDFPAIFTFGGSSSDTGGLSATYLKVPPPYGQTFFGRPAGRFCGGRLMVDFMANGLDLPYLNSYLDSIGANFSHGANFAVGGATARPGVKSFPFSINVQYQQFSQFKSRSILQSKKGGIFKKLLPNEEYFSRALYTFDIGQNDLTACFYSNMTIDDVKAIIPDIVDKIQHAIQVIHKEGGRYFWIQSTTPIGCLPKVLQRVPNLAAPKDIFGCGVLLNDVAQVFNQLLKSSVNQLRKKLSDAHLMYVDVYSAKYGLISEAEKHGFENTLVACCGHGGEYNIDVGCGKVKEVNGTKQILGNSCNNPSSRIIWDGIHYTEAANKFIFDWLSGGAFSDPPLPLKMACHA